MTYTNTCDEETAVECELRMNKACKLIKTSALFVS